MHASFIFVLLAVFSACTLAAPVPADASSGAGGMAPGGSVSSDNSPSWVSILSNNAGDGGEANSGNSAAKDSATTDSPNSSNVSSGTGNASLLGLLGDGGRGSENGNIIY